MSRPSKAHRELLRRTRKVAASVSAIIPGRPIAWARPTDGRGRRVNPEPYRSWRSQAARTVGAAAGFRLLEGPVRVVVDVYADRVEVSAAGGTGAERPAGLTGDIDNYAKAALDALVSAGVLLDDDEVTALEVRFR